MRFLLLAVLCLFSVPAKATLYVESDGAFYQPGWLVNFDLPANATMTMWLGDPLNEHHIPEFPIGQEGYVVNLNIISGPLIPSDRPLFSNCDYCGFSGIISFKHLWSPSGSEFTDNNIVTLRTPDAPGTVFLSLMYYEPVFMRSEHLNFTSITTVYSICHPTSAPWQLSQTYRRGLCYCWDSPVLAWFTAES